MKIIGTWEEYDIVLRALLKYRDALQNANDEGIVEYTVVSPNWMIENTSKQIQGVYDKLEFEKED